MIRIVIEEDKFARLRDLSQNHPHPHIRTKAHALLLRSQRVKNHEITKILGVSENTIRAYCYEYLNGGIDAIATLKFRKPTGKLAPFDEAVKNYLQQTPPATIKQACNEIHALTGIRLEETQMRVYLKKLGASFRKVGSIPAKADAEQQKKFLETELQPRLDEAKVGIRTIYFVDAVHFVLGAFLGYLWSLARVFVKTPSGRQRFNVLGALDAVSNELVTITNDTYITSTQVCELLNLIALKTKNPITVVLDNARYQRCAMVVALANELDIELLFLPPYSPNLNLIERVWKFTKKHCLNSKYYSDFGLFRNAISSFLSSMHKTYAVELNSLLTHKFQMFDA